MNLKDIVPMVIVVVVAFAALALGDVSVERPAAAQKRPAIGSAEWIPASESLLPNEQIVTAAEPPAEDTTPAIEPAEEARPVPAAAAKKAARRDRQVVSRPPAPRRAEPMREARVVRTRVRVEARRLNGDPRVQLAVMDAIAAAPSLSGRIGVETHGSVVRLSGWTMTAAQAARAERAASRVRGVKGVVNEVRPRIGAVSS